jgi:signal peptidase I
MSENIDERVDDVVEEEEKEEDEGFWWWVKPVLIAVGVTLLLRFFVLEAFRVPTGSMEDTIMPGDFVLTEKVSLRFSEPEVGEVVVFNNPANDGTVLVKRVIAKAGQTVDLQNGSVYINGVPLDEPYTGSKVSNPLASQMPGIPEITYPYTVPEGCIWVMGDNRVNSRDSRFFGPVDLSLVFGHGLCIAWPPNDWKAL